MKKSEIYHALQFCVLGSDLFSDEDKLKAIEILMSEERVAKYVESEAEKKEAENQ